MATTQAAVRGIVLAAGQGTRTKHALPKVLQPIAGTPMLHWVLESATRAGCTAITLVLGREKDQIVKSTASLKSAPVTVAIQAEPRGTADAVRVALAATPDAQGYVLVLYGDCPLIPAHLLSELISRTQTQNALAGLVSARLAEPAGYGRLLRDAQGKISAIREHKDCNAEQIQIQDVNPGIYCFELAFLREALSAVKASNAQRELYLTDVIESAAKTHKLVEIAHDMEVLRGVNDLKELAVVNQQAYRQIAEHWAKQGVRIESLDTVCIEASCTLEANANIGASVHLRGTTHVSSGAQIDVGCVLTNCKVGANARVKPYTVATDTAIGNEAEVGPFAHLRAGTELHERAKVGNFSETKNTVVGEGSKVNHLSYVGDGRIGKNVNIGAGTIFCNYNGVSKEITTVGDNVFIGSDSQLIAPIQIGDGAYIASGSTLTRDVPADALALSRAKQENKEGYAKRLLARLKKKA